MVRSVVVVDTDERAARRVADTFALEGWRVRTAALTVEVNDPCFAGADLVVIALAADPVAGLGLCRRLRGHGDVGLVLHTPRNDETEQLAGYASGADEVSVRPFSVRLMMARCEALVRRTQAARRATQGPAPADRLVFDSIEVDTDLRLVTVAGTPVHLTRIEYAVLTLLMDSPHRVVTRREIVTHVWGEWHGDDHAIEAHLSRLRGKIRRAGGPRVGEPVSGIGYRLGRVPSQPAQVGSDHLAPVVVMGVG